MYTFDLACHSCTKKCQYAYKLLQQITKQKYKKMYINTKHMYDHTDQNIHAVKNRYKIATLQENTVH